MTTKGATLPKAGHWLAPRGKPMNTLTDRPLDLGSARPDGLLARARRRGRGDATVVPRGPGLRRRATPGPVLPTHVVLASSGREQRLRAGQRPGDRRARVTSGQALAGVVGPPIEVPVLVGLVHVALWARHRFCPSGEDRP